MYQRRKYYEILCSNQGADLLCEVVFNSIQFRDFRMAAGVSLLQLQYCVVIAQWARLASVALDHGYVSADIPQLSQLLKAVQGLQLPAPLAKYIETIGTLHLVAGVDVAPWFSTREDMQNPQLHQINPDDLLIAADRPIPDNYWSIDRDWISRWNQATTRPSRLGMHFRPILWSETQGSVEMVVTPTISNDDPGVIRPTAPQQLTDAEAQLGGVYYLRDFGTMRHWPAQTSLICTRLMYGTEVYRRDCWSEVVVAAFTGSDKN